jgi:circadian clock protein KaiC
LTSPNVLLGNKGDSILDEPIKEVQARRVVLDSLSHFQMFIPQSEMRMEVYRLVNYLKTRGLSSILIWETPQILGQALSLSEVGLSFLVDCIIFLRVVEIQSAMRNALVILNMRGSGRDKRLREYEGHARDGDNGDAALLLGIELRECLKGYEAERS